MLSGGLPECVDGAPVADGTACDDGDAATSNDQCSGGLCMGDSGTCVVANGLTWCFDDSACGEACTEVCAALGLSLIADNIAWFQAQDSLAECQAISQAFGLGTNAFTFFATFACLEDNFGTHSVGGGLLSPLICSTFSGCPDNHRTNMDQLGIACGPGSRRSICPCE